MDPIGTPTGPYGPHRPHKTSIELYRYSWTPVDSSESQFAPLRTSIDMYGHSLCTLLALFESLSNILSQSPLGTHMDLCRSLKENYGPQTSH